MKKVTIYALLGFLFFLNTASMCSSDDSSSLNNQSDVINTATSGTWKITLYNDSDVIKTSDFAGYNFTFNSNGVLSAVGVDLTIDGTWSVTDTNSSDDSIDDLDFYIFFTSPVNFAELSDDWDIISKTATKIELIDVSGGNGETDYLTFEKN
jgi:hypothetical protein